MEGDGDVELGLGPAVLVSRRMESVNNTCYDVTALHVWNT